MPDRSEAPQKPHQALQNVLKEADTGEGLKFPKWAKFYVSYILPLIVLFIFVQGYISKFRPFREFQSFSGIRFFQEVLPSPSITACTEQKIDQTSKWKQVITYQEILQIQSW